MPPPRRLSRRPTRPPLAAVSNSTKRPTVRPATPLGERLGGLEHEIVRKLAARPAGGPAHARRKIATWRKAQSIADAGESDQALDVVIAVGRGAKNAERQIDLGGRPFEPAPGGTNQCSDSEASPR